MTTIATTMFSRARTMLRPDRLRKRRPLHVCQESEKAPCHRQTFNNHEYLRNIAQELNNVAVDLYRRGDYTTAIDLYKDAVKAIMGGIKSKGNTVLPIDAELRSGFITQIIRGKQQLYQSAWSSQSDNDELDSYQWTESEADGGSRYLSEAIKIESEQGHRIDDDNVHLATVMYNTALIHMKNGDLGTAESCFDLSMECFDLEVEQRKLNETKNFASNVLVFADLFNNIGCIQYRDGNITKAKESFTKALVIGNNVLRQTRGNCKNRILQGYKHVGTIYYNIGVVNAGLGLKDKVMVPLEYSLELQKVALGESHPDIAVVQHSIGMVFVGIGQCDDAMNAFLESLRIVRFVYGNDDYQVAKTLFHLGKIHEMKGEYDEALNAYQETLRIERLKLGVIHPETVMTMYEIGKIYQNKGDLTEALGFYRDILSVSDIAGGISESS
eukprot:CAMPEP_0172521444 /NCGR_PEP_ID=MMETSP1066-20121228/292582_1 /TAXON_ID=671091 /ORGANISM="Coscinodiscus wailesii, Strain CCMP2513" /LENGTH=441 /DNA_ID=CAMNT_0013304357 /DNA_START=48 /DNA_END=1369 /DNA_ORIENTATION=+